MNNPQKYVEFGKLSPTDAYDIINEFATEVKVMHGKVVDIGSGPGNVTRDIILPHLPDDATVVGTDICPDMVRYAEEHKKNRKRLSFIEFNIEASPLPINFIQHFDHVVSFFCLQWCQKKKLTASNIYKLLQPGGTGLVAYPIDHKAFNIFLKHRKDPKYSMYIKDSMGYIDRHWNQSDPVAMHREDLEDAGFEVLLCEKRWRNYNFTNLHAFMGLLTTVDPAFDIMPEELQQIYSNDLKKDVKMEYMIDNEDAPIADKYAILVAYFRKPGQS